VTPTTNGAILHPPETAARRFDTVARLERSDAIDGVDLVRLAQRGSSEAFDRLAAPRINRSYRLAVAILRSEVDARDAVQDAYISAWRQLRTLRDPARFDAWLDRIVVNACRMAMRHRHTVRIHELELRPPLENETVAEVEILRAAFKRLTVDQRALLVLHHVEDRPIEEIALVLDKPAGTVKWRLHAARNALRRAIDEESR
jgi:RNA polymerase sigma factor (sigma-70 family)